MGASCNLMGKICPPLVEIGLTDLPGDDRPEHLCLVVGHDFIFDM